LNLTKLKIELPHERSARTIERKGGVLSAIYSYHCLVGSQVLTVEARGIAKGEKGDEEKNGSLSR
jgi:hypothetical protein